MGEKGDGGERIFENVLSLLLLSNVNGVDVNGVGLKKCKRVTR